LVLTVVLVGAIAYKLRLQAVVLTAPAGGSGIVEGTAITVASQISARIEQILVEEGRTVKAGDRLLVLDCRDIDATIAEAEARVASAEATRDGAAASVKVARRSAGAAYAQVLAARTRGQVTETREAAAARQAARLQQVGDGVTVAALDQSQSEAASLALEKEAAAAATRATAAQAGAADAQGLVAEAQARAAEAAVASAQAALARARILRRDCELVAPRAGVVDQVFFEVGELPARGATLVRLVDLDEVTVTFYLPNAELAAAKTGARVAVTADAYPGVSFAGTVRTVAVEAAFTPRNVQTRTDRDRLVYPIEVVVPNPEHRLRPGMPAEVRATGW
ncbi:MAG TPA: efflux RND transporter periplasmic adaptor subunit, partial [Polyangiaceae bacterium]|nr:efflux RND transporter periplasmic adaptor subunit [Polyangiaceae bacterium]